MDGMDPERMERIARPALSAVVDNFHAGPPSQHRLEEALNAMACVVGTIIAGFEDTEGREASRAFFDQALDTNLVEMINVRDGILRRTN